MKHFSLILLLFAFLWSTSGIGMLMHYCEGKLAQSSFYGLGATNSCHDAKREICQAQTHLQGACCALHKEKEKSHDGFEKNQDRSCCKDQFFYLKIADEFLALASLNMGRKLPSPAVKMQWGLSWDAILFFQHENPAFRQQALALHEVPISILFQQFRL